MTEPKEPRDTPPPEPQESEVVEPETTEVETATGAAPTHTDLMNAPRAPSPGTEGAPLSPSEIVPEEEVEGEEYVLTPEEEANEEPVEEPEDDKAERERILPKRYK